MRHPSQETLLRYLSGKARESEAEVVIAHLDGCEACSQRAAALRSLRSDFDSGWQRFEQELLHRSRSIETPTREARGLGIPPLRGLLDAGRAIASAAADLTSGVAAGFEVVFVPVFQGTGDPQGLGEAGNLARRASDALGRGDSIEADSLLEDASRRHPDAVHLVTLDLRLEGKSVGRVVADARLKRLAVVLYLPPHIAPPATAVLRTDRDPAGRRAAFEAVPGADYLLAEFINVVDGAFRVSFE